MKFKGEAVALQIIFLDVFVSEHFIIPISPEGVLNTREYSFFEHHATIITTTTTTTTTTTNLVEVISKGSREIPKSIKVVIVRDDPVDIEREVCASTLLTPVRKGPDVELITIWGGTKAIGVPDSRF